MPDLCRSGVYKITCSECNCIYVGQTGRSLRERYCEHALAYEKGKKEKSAFAGHLIDTGHALAGSTIQLIHNASKGRLMSMLEEVEIATASTCYDAPILNLPLGSNFCPVVDYFVSRGDRDSMMNFSVT